MRIHAPRVTTIAFALGIAAASGAGCSSGSSSASDASTTGGDGGMFVMCDQACVDIGSGVTLANLINDLYNTNLAGHPVGNQSLVASCPVGGQAIVSGTTGFDSTHGITTVNLTYMMDACQKNANGVQITVTGTVTEVGSFDSSMLQSLNETSDALTIDGTVEGVTVDDAQCMVHVNVDSNSTPELTGTVCGRSF